MPTDAVYVAPAKVPHFLMAKEEVLYQEAGMGPTKRIFLNR